MKESICVYCHCKKNLKMKINEYRKKGCDKDGNPFKLKLYPPLKNVVEGVHLAKGGNILEYRVKANALLKLNNIRLLTTLVLQGVQTFEHMHTKEETAPLEIHDKIQKEFVVVHKKCCTKHGGQPVKQVPKP